MKKSLPFVNRLSRLFLPVPKVHFANAGFDEGDNSTHETGNVPYKADVLFPNRFTLVIIGSDEDHIAPSSSQSDLVLGVTTDAPYEGDPNNPTADLDLPVSVAVFGAVRGTLRVMLSGTVNAGDLLQSNGDGGAITLLTTTGTFYVIGRALIGGVAGEIIEFTPAFPIKVVNS